MKKLPSLDLNGGSQAIASRPRDSSVLLLIRAAALPLAHRYIRSLEERVIELRSWDAQLLVMTEAGDGQDDSELAYAGPAAWQALEIAEGKSALIVADRWDVIYVNEQTEEVEDLPPVDEIVDWVRFLATQCPECGVIDEPGRGEWEP